MEQLPVEMFPDESALVKVKDEKIAELTKDVNSIMPKVHIMKLQH